MTPSALQRLATVVNVDDLMSRCLGNIDFLERILTIFKSRCELDLCELDEAVQSADIHHVKRLAHRLKGACDSAGAQRLSVLANELWTAAGNASDDELAELFALLRSDWEECARNLPGDAGTASRSS